MDDTDEDGGDCDDDMTGPKDVDGAIDDDVGMTDDWVELICHNGDSGFCNDAKKRRKLSKIKRIQEMKQNELFGVFFFVLPNTTLCRCKRIVFVSERISI